MATATITNRTYSNAFDAQTSTFLIGNAGDIIDLTLDFDVEIKTESSTTNVFTVTNNDTIEIGIGNLQTEGFIIGGSVDIVLNHNSGVKNVSGTISVLTATKMVLTGLTGDTLENGLYPDTASNNGIAEIESSEPIEGLELNYNLITNTDAQGGGNTASVIDGSVTIFKNNNLDATDTVTLKNLVPFGYQSGMAIQSATIVGLGIASGVQSFRVAIKFMILPDWDSSANFQNNTLPTSNANNECLTDYISAKFQPQASNPNVFVQTDSSQQAILGNTGWFNENYNGGAVTNYSTKLGSSYIIEFANALNTLNVPDVQTLENTNFRLTLANVGANTNRKYKIGFLWLPDDATIYSSKNYRFDQNLLYVGAGDATPLQSGNTNLIFTGQENSDGARIDLEIKQVFIPSTGVTMFDGVFKPNAAFSTYMNTVTGGGVSNLNYVMWVSVGDETLGTLNSDRVSVIAKFGQLQATASSYNLGNVVNSFLNHAQPASQVGVSDIETCVEDEVLARSIIYLDTSQNEFIEELTFSIDCVSNAPIGFGTAPEIFNLESNSYDCTQYPIDASGTQQIAISTTRGFKMAAGVDKNLVTVERSPSDDYGTFVAYRALYAFRPRWEDWEQNLDVNSWFFNTSELNNGLNNDWATKDNPTIITSTLWNLQYSVQLRVNQNGTIVRTKNAFDFSVRDYEESTIWDGAITCYNTAKTTSLFIGVNADGIRENGLVQSDKTWVEADFDLEDVFGDVGAITDYYGVIRMEEYRNGGLFAIDMLSTTLTNETTQNFLVPLTGETACKITKISATKIRLECYVDNAQLNPNVANYKISARLGMSNINLGKYSRHYSLKYN